MLFSLEELQERNRLMVLLQSYVPLCSKRKARIVLEAPDVAELYELHYGAPFKILTEGMLIALFNILGCEDDKYFGVVDIERCDELQPKTIGWLSRKLTDETLIIALTQIIRGKRVVSADTTKSILSVFLRNFVIVPSNKFSKYFNARSRVPKKQFYDYYILICSVFGWNPVPVTAFFDILEKDFHIRTAKGYSQGRSGVNYVINCHIPETPEDIDLSLDYGMGICTSEIDGQRYTPLGIRFKDVDKSFIKAQKAKLGEFYAEEVKQVLNGRATEKKSLYAEALQPENLPEEAKHSTEKIDTAPRTIECDSEAGSVAAINPTEQSSIQFDSKDDCESDELHEDLTPRKPRAAKVVVEKIDDGCVSPLAFLNEDF